MTRLGIAFGPLVAAVLIAGCTGPSPTPPVTTPPATATPSQGAELRGRPEVAVIEQWAEAYALAINASDGSFAAARPLMTEAGLSRMELYTRGDWTRYLPGPVPIRVTALLPPDERGVVVAEACAQFRGWSWASETDRSRERRAVTPVSIGVVERDGVWLVDGMGDRDGDCAGVEVPDTLW